MSQVMRFGRRALEVSAFLLAWAIFNQPTSYAQTFALSDTKDLVLINTKAGAVEYKGRKAVRLTKDVQKDGFALLKGTDFQDGTIEADIALKITTPPERRLPGLAGTASGGRRVAHGSDLSSLRPGTSHADAQGMRNNRVNSPSDP